MAKKSKLNGSVDALAKAMRQVFTEAVEAGVQPIKESVDGLRTDMESMEGRLNKRIDTTDENVSVQLAEHNKKYGKILKEGGATR